MRILVVEDHRDILDLWEEYLTERGYEADRAEDGEVAINKLKKREYGLIILDLMLPRVDGFDVLDFLEREGIKVPVLAVTGEVIEDAKRRVFAYPQVKEFLFKPISPSELLRVVEYNINR